MRTPAAYISLKIWQIAFSIARNYIKIGVTALIDSSLHIAQAQTELYHWRRNSFELITQHKSP